MGIVYKLKNMVTNREYIGYSLYSLEKRFRQHCSMALKPSLQNTKTNKLWNSIRKHGIDCWKKEILFESNDITLLKETERKFIKESNTYNDGYNSTIGGDGIMSGTKHTKESIEKIRKSSTGRIFTEKTKKKIGNANKGKISKITLDASILARQSTYKISFPNTETIIVSNLANYCKLNNITYTSLLSCRGKIPKYGKFKGWKLEKINV